MSISKIIKTVANIYLCLFGIFWSGCMIAIFAARGFIGVQETLSPFNIGNYIVTAIFLLPYLFLNKIATKVEAKFGEKDTMVRKEKLLPPIPWSKEESHKANEKANKYAREHPEALQKWLQDSEQIPGDDRPSK